MSTLVEQETPVQPPPLNALDRCDACGGRAYVRVLLTSGGELLFCGHHFRKHEPSLVAVVDFVQDEREKLLQPPG